MFSRKSTSSFESDLFLDQRREVDALCDVRLQLQQPPVSLQSPGCPGSVLYSLLVPRAASYRNGPRFSVNRLCARWLCPLVSVLSRFQKDQAKLW